MKTQRTGKHGISRHEYRQRMGEYLPRGEECKNHVLTDALVKQIRENKHGKTFAQWGRELNIPWTTIRDAANYATWSHVK